LLSTIFEAINRGSLTTSASGRGSVVSVVIAGPDSWAFAAISWRAPTAAPPIYDKTLRLSDI
jgi:hypothetical protein